MQESSLKIQRPSNWSWIAFLGVALPLLSACGIPSLDERRSTAGAIASAKGFVEETIATPTFKIRTFSRTRGNSEDLVVYFEGDGFAFVSRIEVSLDPTPIDPLGLRLAVQDSRDRVLYVARPCQYVGIEARSSCNLQYWTIERFSEPVVAAINAAIDSTLRVRPARRLHLVGFSGGGAIASLIAARRTDVATLVTIAGNLDHRALNLHHRVTPLTGSLNPIESAALLRSIPQIHYSGGDDEIVPPFVATRFVAAQSPSGCVRHVVRPAATHVKFWVEDWIVLHRDFPICR